MLGKIALLGQQEMHLEFCRLTNLIAGINVMHIEFSIFCLINLDNMIMMIDKGSWE